MLALGKRGARGQLTLPAIVLRRSDFRESSRIVTTLTREHGRLHGLAKGAHRPNSPFLGRLDFLNEVQATFSADRGGLRLLVGVQLVQEHRALREPLRFLAASHLAQLCDGASHDGVGQPELYDLLQGGLNLLERCAALVLPQVLLGLELRYLRLLGNLPQLARCNTGGCDLTAGAFRDPAGPGFCCRQHAGSPRSAVADEVRLSLLLLVERSGKEWPSLQLPAAAQLSERLVGNWLEHALQLRSAVRATFWSTVAAN